MNNFIDLLKQHFKKYPLMHAEDIYKLAYQFYFGPAHFIEDKEKAWNYLLEEAKECLNTEIEVVDVGEYVRVNVINDETYLKNLFGAFVKSAKASDKSIDGFDKIMDICISYLEQMPDILKDFTTLKDKMKNLRYPAISHSQKYRDYYRPHYRLVHKDYLSLITK